MRLAPSILTIALWSWNASALGCGDMDFLGDAVNIDKTMVSPLEGAHGSIQVVGGGWFHATEVVKTGGSDDNTTVVIELDGLQMLSISFATLKNPWMQVETAYFMANVRTEGETSRMTIWYTPELNFRGIMAVRVFVTEADVRNVQVHAVLNKPAPHEHLAGQPNLSNLPIFK
jgi:hypothetical protein